MRAVDHAVETLYASHRHPVSAAQAATALAALVAHLPPSLDAGAAGRIGCSARPPRG